MPQQRLLAISDLSLTVYRWRSGLLNLEQAFPADASGLVQWDDYLRRNRHAIFSVFAALADESMQTEEVPHATGADRSALIERKLAQRFPGSTYKFSQMLGRNNSGRRDEKILLAALNRPEILEPWLAILQRADARLAGIYTAPLLAERLVSELANGESRFLLIALFQGGLQQMFFEHKHLRFARSIAADTEDMAAVAELCASESATLLQYLATQRLAAADGVMPVVVLLNDRDVALFRSICRDQGSLRYSFADLPAIARKHGLRTPPEDSCSEALFLHLMVRRPAAAQYAPPGLRRFYHLGRVNLLLIAVTASLSLASLFSAARDLTQGHRLTAEQTALAASIAATGRDYQQALALQSPSQLDSASLRTLADLIESLRRQENDLPRLLAQLSRVLDRFEAVELERLDWRPSDEQARANPAYVMDIDARLPRISGSDDTAQADTVRRFAAALQGVAAAAVSTRQWPAAIDAQRKLSPDQLAQMGQETPHFQLRLLIAAQR